MLKKCVQKARNFHEISIQLLFWFIAAVLQQVFFSFSLYCNYKKILTTNSRKGETFFATNSSNPELVTYHWRRRRKWWEDSWEGEGKNINKCRSWLIKDGEEKKYLHNPWIERRKKKIQFSFCNLMFFLNWIKIKIKIWILRKKN